MMDLPLKGIRVLDLTRILAGPSCTQILGDLGADIIKIERPGSGDDTRGWGPPFLQDEHGEPTRESAYYLSTNRNKRSLSLDIATPQGRELLQELLGQSDILVENFKVGDLNKRGFGWKDVHAQFPKVIYCSITGFGQDGPYSGRPGYDFIIQGMGGLMSITGDPHGQPMKVGVPISDIMSGMYACVSILAALRQREQTGEGQHIDISLLDVQLAWLYNQASNYLVGGEEPGRLGNAHPNIVPYETFATKDGYINIGIGNDGQFQRFCTIADCSGLATDPRFNTNTLRLKHRNELVPALQQVFIARPSAYWLTELEQHAIPCGPINTISEVFKDPHVRHRGMLTKVHHPAAGDQPIPLVASPIKMSGARPEIRHAPPSAGQHTEEILSELLGLDALQVDALKKGGIV